MLERPRLHDFLFMPGIGGTWCVTTQEREWIVEDIAKLMATVEWYEAQARVMNSRGE